MRLTNIANSQFETQPDGTIIYYCKSGGRGVIIDRQLKRRIQAFYGVISLLYIGVVVPTIYYLHGWGGFLLGMLLALGAWVKHERLVQGYPLAPIRKRRGFSTRCRNIADAIPLWLLLVWPPFMTFVAYICWQIYLAQQHGILPLVLALLFLFATFCLFFILGVKLVTLLTKK